MFVSGKDRGLHRSFDAKKPFHWRLTPVKSSRRPQPVRNLFTDIWRKPKYTRRLQKKSRNTSDAIRLLFPPVSGILLMTYSVHSTVYFQNLLLNFSSFSSLCFCKFVQDKFVNQMLWRDSILPILIPKNIILMLALH